MDVIVKGIDKAAALMALYEYAVPLGMGVFQARKDAMTRTEAERLLAECPSFDYLHGRPLKIRFDDAPEGFLIRRTDLYDRDQGPDAARTALEAAGATVIAA